MTVLANEQVISGRCERCNTPVEQRRIAQWFFRITEFAERLLANLEGLDWSETTKKAQQNWIGRSEGTILRFPILPSGTQRTATEPAHPGWPVMPRPTAPARCLHHAPRHGVRGDLHGALTRAPAGGRSHR